MEEKVEEEEIEEIRRTIYFYQLQWITTEGKKVVKGTKFFNDILGKSRNIEVNDVYDLLLKKKPTPHKNIDDHKSYWTLSKNRKKDLPLKYDKVDDEEKSLGFGDQEALSEPSHFVLYDGKIIGAELNSNGKSVGTGLSDIITDILLNNPHQGICAVEINKILRPDAFSRINRIIEIRGVEYKIASNYAKLLVSEENSYAEALSTSKLVDDMYITFSFTIGNQKDARSERFQNLFNIITSIIKRKDSLDYLKRVAIRGREKSTEDIHTINLLKDFLISKTKVPKIDKKTKAVISNDMFIKIDQIHESYKTELSQFIESVVNEKSI